MAFIVREMQPKIGVEHTTRRVSAEAHALRLMPELGSTVRRVEAAADADHEEEPEAPKTVEAVVLPMGSGVFADFSWLSFIGHSLWRGPLISALSVAAYTSWVASTAAFEATVALSAFPLLPYVAIAGLAAGIVWSMIESMDRD